MIVRMADLLARLPQPATDAWPDGVFDLTASELEEGSLVFFAPKGADYQQPHGRDEIYIVISGSATFILDKESCDTVHVGDAIVVEAGRTHHFESMTDDFATWVVFVGARTPHRDPA